MCLDLTYHEVVNVKTITRS